MIILVLSDLHLTTKPNPSKVDKLCSIVRAFKGRYIILNGDIVDLWYSNGLIEIVSANKPFFTVLDDKAKQGVEVIWVEGNHDEKIASLMSLNRIRIVKGFSLKDRRKKIVFIHGDQFDPKIIKYYWWGKWFNRFNGWFDRYFDTNVGIWFQQKFDKFIKKGKPNSTDELSILEIIKTYSQDYDIIVVGHYHMPEVRELTIDTKPVIYANSGDWVAHQSYLTITNGIVKVFQ